MEQTTNRYVTGSFNMAKLKKFVGHCTGGKTMALHNVIVEAINPPQAREFLKARYPGYSKYYTSSQL